MGYLPCNTRAKSHLAMPWRARTARKKTFRKAALGSSAPPRASQGPNDTLQKHVELCGTFGRGFTDTVPFLAARTHPLWFVNCGTIRHCVFLLITALSFVVDGCRPRKTAGPDFAGPSSPRRASSHTKDKQLPAAAPAATPKTSKKGTPCWRKASDGQEATDPG
jgi:hypothetical protein